MAFVSFVQRAAAVEVVRNRNLRRAIGLGAFVALTAFGAHVAVPVPVSPVPVTLQTLFVILAGAVLGPRLGAASQLAYLALGAAGAPVFAGVFGMAALAGPTGGYLLAFPIAAALAGVAVRGGNRGALHAVRVGFGAIAASAVILLIGALQLTLYTGDFANAVVAGVLPFLVGDALKAMIGATIAVRLRKRTLGLF